ncbi:MAG TPA: dihydrodipicolinate synthase family protein [Candidatus Dormibacteraeota bacterium]|jgi:4-hydroxy-2-oxoglutarate aldolase|nr:dihydrodipicolinate synthase family protein [Candidatus Dormibacteraeota bacterium]
MEAAWLRGVFPPIPTAFAPDGSLRESPAAFLEYLRDGGVDGVVALGSNGEAPNLTEGERLRSIQRLRETLPAPLRLIAGTGADSTSATIERTAAAAKEGAEAALVIAPSYFRRHLTAQSLRRHYHAVADASPIPILIYNMPAHMGYDLGVEWIVKIAGHRNLAGVKDSSGDIARLSTLRRELGPDFVLLPGSGEKLLEALQAGADGGIVALANLAPAASARIRQAWVGGDIEQARRQQRAIAPLGEAMSGGYGVPGLKAALRILGYDHGDPRPPLPALPADELASLRRLLEDAGLMPRALAS